MTVHSLTRHSLDPGGSFARLLAGWYAFMDTVSEYASFKAIRHAGATGFILAAYSVLLEGRSVAILTQTFFVAGLILLAFSSLQRRSSVQDSGKLYRFIRQNEENILEKFKDGQDQFNDDLDSAIKAHLDRIVTITSTVLSREVKDSCSVAIKLLCSVPDKQGHAPTVHTFLRDARSSYKRAALSPEGFSYQLNTAFDAIVHQDARDGYYVQDDLAALATSYRNSNRRWSELYNSTAVKGIERRDRDKRTIIGFLCVDTVYGTLSSDRIKHFLGVVSEHIYTALGLLVLAKQTREDHSSPLRGGAGPQIGWMLDGTRLVASNPEHIKQFERTILNLRESTEDDRSKAPYYGLKSAAENDTLSSDMNKDRENRIPANQSKVESGIRGQLTQYRSALENPALVRALEQRFRTPPKPGHVWEALERARSRYIERHPYNIPPPDLEEEEVE